MSKTSISGIIIVGILAFVAKYHEKMSPELLTAVGLTGLVLIGIIVAVRTINSLRKTDWRNILIALIAVPALAGIFYFLMGLTWQGALQYTLGTIPVLFAAYYLVLILRMSSPPVSRFKRFTRLLVSFCMLVTAIFIPVVVYKTGHKWFFLEGIGSAFFMFGIFILGFIGLVSFVANLIRLILGR